METIKQKQNCWAIILAGGEQKLAADLHCSIAGEKTPRQFSRAVDGQSLIEQTRRRVEDGYSQGSDLLHTQPQR
jgi:mannose-1-phosphate guanylyltransferase